MSVPITFIDKDKGESVAPATGTLAATKGVNESHSSTRDNKNMKTIEARPWKRRETREPETKKQKKKLGSLNEVRKVTVGKKRRCGAEKKEDNDGERKKAKGPSTNQSCKTVEAEVQPHRAQRKS